MKFRSTFHYGVKENMLQILTGLSKVEGMGTFAMVIGKETGIEFRGSTDTATAIGKIGLGRFMIFEVESKSNNNIAVECDVQTFLKAFKSEDNSEEISLKLTKKQGHVCFAMTSKTISDMLVVQHVPVVAILKADDMSRYREPVFAAADATMLFPEPKSAKAVMERMHRLDKFVKLKADDSVGSLVFRIDTDVVSTKTVFSGLQIPLSEEDELERRPKSARVGGHGTTVLLSSKELLHVTSALLGFGDQAEKIVLAIVSESAVCIHVSFSDVDSDLTYYLSVSPHQYDQASDEEENNKQTEDEEAEQQQERGEGDE